EVGARVQIERPAGRDVPVLDRDRAEAVDVGEEVHAAEVVGGGRDEPQQELARRRDRAREIAERDQVGAPRAPCAEAGTDRHAAARHRVTDRAAEVHAPATRLALAPRQPAAETRTQLADQLPGLLHVARGEFAEGEGEEPAGARGAALAARDLSGVPRLGARGRLAAMAVLLPLVAEPRPPAVPAPASRSRRHRTAAGAARAAPAPLLGAADERERLVEEAVEGGPIRLVLHQRRGERLAHRLALHADRGDGYERIERFGDR